MNLFIVAACVCHAVVILLNTCIFPHHDKCLAKWIYVSQGDEISYVPGDVPTSQTLASIVFGGVPGFCASPDKSPEMRLSGSPHFVM